MLRLHAQQQTTIQNLNSTCLISWENQGIETSGSRTLNITEVRTIARRKYVTLKQLGSRLKKVKPGFKNIRLWRGSDYEPRIVSSSRVLIHMWTTLSAQILCYSEDVSSLRGTPADPSSVPSGTARGSRRVLWVLDWDVLRRTDPACTPECPASRASSAPRCRKPGCWTVPVTVQLTASWCSVWLSQRWCCVGSEHVQWTHDVILTHSMETWKRSLKDFDDLVNVLHELISVYTAMWEKHKQLFKCKPTL